MSLLKLTELDGPVTGLSTLYRKQNALAVHGPYWRADGAFNLLIDSSGIKLLDDAE